MTEENSTPEAVDEAQDQNCGDTSVEASAEETTTDDAPCEGDVDGESSEVNEEAPAEEN